jgi:hypothetical protein
MSETEFATDNPYKVIENGVEYFILEQDDYIEYTNKDGLVHREGDNPAIIYASGKKKWFKEGSLHRENDQPAIIDEYGSQSWYKNGQRHREGDEPSYVGGSFGGPRFWRKHDILHRDNDKPAIITQAGCRYWYKNGSRHRDNDKPSIILSDDHKEWWKEGRRYLPGYNEIDSYSEFYFTRINEIICQ